IRHPTAVLVEEAELRYGVEYRIGVLRTVPDGCYVFLLAQNGQLLLLPTGTGGMYNGHGHTCQKMSCFHLILNTGNVSYPLSSTQWYSLPILSYSKSDVYQEIGGWKMACSIRNR